MNELQVFTYSGNEVRTVKKNGEPWFVLKDVCAILSIGNVADVCARLDTDEKGADKYVLGEINCSCVGFTSHLELAPEVAEYIIKIVSKAKA